MSEFTKGEWKVSSDGTSIFNNISDEPFRNWIIAECNTKHSFFNHNEKRANAQLIAHAPQMLDMLTEIVKWSKTKDGTFTFITSAEKGEEIKQLIQQATTIK